MIEKFSTALHNHSCQNRAFRANLIANSTIFRIIDISDLNAAKKRSFLVYRISILTDLIETGQTYADWTKHFCTENGLFPRIELYHDKAEFFNHLVNSPPTGIILALEGVAGLNAAEHIRALLPNCGLIWCCDLDFSLHAFRLRADYFVLLPIRHDGLRDGLTIWIENVNRQKPTSRYRDRQENMKELVYRQ